MEQKEIEQLKGRVTLLEKTNYKLSNAVKWYSIAMLAIALTFLIKEILSQF